jgi:hypothetical protein
MVRQAGRLHRLPLLQVQRVGHDSSGPAELLLRLLRLATPLRKGQAAGSLSAALPFVQPLFPSLPAADVGGGLFNWPGVNTGSSCVATWVARR